MRLAPLAPPAPAAAAAAALLMLAVAPVAAAAQETPTERSAAADVIRRMNELERSLALPQLVARLTARDPRRDAVIARARALMERELLGMAAGIAVAEFLTSSKTPGTVTLYGTPAEEVGTPEAKTIMYESGVFNGADVLVRSHSSTATQRSAPGFGSCCMNIDVLHYTFSGAPAHQLQAWEGRDALMGVIELFNHIDGLRKNVRPETRNQGIITEGGKAPNVVPDRAAAEVWIRYPDAVYLAQLRDRVNDAARGAALATGTKLRIDADSAARDGISIASLNEVAFAYQKQLGATKLEQEPGRPSPYEETGVLATQIPGVGVTSHSSNGGYHTFEMEADALSEVGHRGFLIDV